MEAALAHGVNLVELDVFGRPDRTLVLGHSRKELGEEPVTLEDVFAFLAGAKPEVGLLADLKGAGWEQELVDALRRHDLVERTVASTSNVATLQTLRRLIGRIDLRAFDQPTARLALVLAAKYGLRAADATHLATAVAGGAEWFVTNNRKDLPRTIAEIDVVYPEQLPG